MLLSADYSQIELRLLAHIADIAALKEAFRDGRSTSTRCTASRGVRRAGARAWTASCAARAKTINFGIIYGISAFGLAQQLGIPHGEAQRLHRRLFRAYPGIRAYMERTKAEARDKGYVTTLFGRRCYIPEINDKQPARRAATPSAPRSTRRSRARAADIIKRAMVRAWPRPRSGQLLDARMLLQVHDELVFEVPEDQVRGPARWSAA